MLHSVDEMGLGHGCLLLGSTQVQQQHRARLSEHLWQMRWHDFKQVVLKPYLPVRSEQATYSLSALPPDLFSSSMFSLIPFPPANTNVGT